MPLFQVLPWNRCVGEWLGAWSLTPHRPGAKSSSVPCSGMLSVNTYQTLAPVSVQWLVKPRPPHGITNTKGVNTCKVFRTGLRIL